MCGMALVRKGEMIAMSNEMVGLGSMELSMHAFPEL